MNVSELQSVQARERQSDSLQELRPSFYGDAADFVAELREERERAAADAEDPFEDPEVTKLTDDIRTAEGTIEAIYERRVGKIVKLASLAASGMPTEEDGLTTEERELYETLVEAIERHREDVLSTLTEGTPTDGSPATEADRSATDRPANEASATAEAVAGSDDDSGAVDRSTGDGHPESDPQTESIADRDADEERSRSDAADEPPAEDDRAGETAGTAPDESGNERTTVRITEDVGAILGVDEREYDLATDDVVTLPAENAAPLIERDAAEPIE